MKRYIPSIIFLLILAMMPLASFASVSIIPRPNNNIGLVGYWPFDGSTINWKTGLITDLSGNGNNGSVISMSTSSSPTLGKLGQALSFNGVTQYINVGNIGNVQTVSMWVKPQSTTQSILDLNGTQTIDISSGTVRANSFSGATIYVDGVASSVFPDTNWHLVSITNASAIGASAVTIGKISAAFYGGNLDDVRIYNRALSASEVASLYNSGQSHIGGSSIGLTRGSSLQNGLAGAWTFDGSTINWTTGLVKDLSGNGSNGNAVSMSTTSSPVAGKFGQALNFDGAASYVNVGNAGSVQSISMWVKPQSTTQSILDLNGTANIDILSGTVRGNNFTAPTIYVDGAVSSTFPDTGWHLITITTGSAISASAVKIGKISTNFFAGALDDVRAYNRALSAAEVKQLYGIGSSKIVKAPSVPSSCGTGSNVTFTDIGGGQCRAFLTSGTSWTVPTNWNSSNNTIEAIGGGGGGSSGGGNAGGGGGEYRKASNVTYTSGHSITIQVGQGGAGAVHITTPDGGAGTASFVENDANSANVVLANGGGGGVQSTFTAGAGGTGGTGAVGNNGGAGGTGSNSGSAGGAGGGGAGGPNGPGFKGGNAVANVAGSGGGGTGTSGTAGIASNSSTGGNGGAGGAGTGGGIGSATGNGGNATIGSGGGGGGAAATGASTGGAGATGSEWDSTHGPGGGGGGGGSIGTTGGKGGAAALYGGGGGSGCDGGTDGDGGAGANGIIVITYTP